MKYFEQVDKSFAKVRSHNVFQSDAELSPISIKKIDVSVNTDRPKQNCVLHRRRAELELDDSGLVSGVWIAEVRSPEVAVQGDQRDFCPPRIGRVSISES